MLLLFSKLNLLFGKEKKKIFFIFFLNFISSLFDVIGLSILIPLIGLLTEGFFLDQKLEFINQLILNFNYFNLSPIIFFSLLLFLTFTIKFLFFIFQVKYVVNFTNNSCYNLSSLIFKKYLIQKYNFYLNHSSSSLIQNLNTQISTFTNAFILHIFFLINESIIFFIIICFLFFLSPISSLVFFIFFCFIFFVFLFIFRKKMSIWGSQNQLLQIDKTKIIQETLINIKELKIHGYGNYFLNSFKDKSFQIKKIESNINFLQSIPKYFIEFLGIVSFVLILSTLHLLAIKNVEIITTLSVFAAAAIKLMPSINRILSSTVVINYSKISLDVILKDLQLKETFKLADSKRKISNIGGNLFFKNVTFKFEKAKKNIFDNLSIKIPLKKKIVIFGKSGSGKTTLVDLITGILEPNTGKINFKKFEINSKKKDLRVWQNSISYVPQMPIVFQDTVKANVIFGYSEKEFNYEKFEECIEIVGLKEFLKKLPLQYETQMNELGKNFSGGQKQRLLIARALYRNPSILILDESTNSLDGKSERVLLKKLINYLKDKTIIMISHNSKNLDLFEKKIFIKDKKVFIN